MAQPEPKERSFRVRKDAKIALIVILALMVLVVIIWGRSPRPGDDLAVSPPQETAKTPEPAAPPPKTDTPAPDLDAARAGAPADHPTGHSSLFPAETAMMNHLQPAPDRAVVRHDPTAPVEDRVAMRPEDAADAPAPDPAPRPAERPAPKPAVTHVVVKGDTYIGLAHKYYSDKSKWRLIQDANGGRTLLRIGQKLTIPPLPDATPAPTAPAAAPAAPARPTPAGPAKPPRKTYTVKRGDSFISIARALYHDAAKWRKLYEANRTKLPNPAKPDSLRYGTVLEVPTLASSQ